MSFSFLLKKLDDLKRKFLNLPIPEGPIPHENKTGTNWMLEYGWQSDFFKKVQKACAVKVLTLIVKSSLIAIGVYATVRNLNADNLLFLKK